jgi:Fe-S-cluster containining protein
MRVLALNIHAGFECRHSGACCTAGWPIPVESDALGRIHSAAASLRPALRLSGPLPDGAAAVIAPLPGGACPFFEPDAGRRCAIQRRLGHDAGRPPWSSLL